MVNSTSPALLVCCLFFLASPSNTSVNQSEQSHWVPPLSGYDEEVAGACLGIPVDEEWSLRATWAETDNTNDKTSCDKVREFKAWGPLVSRDLQKCACALHIRQAGNEALRMMRAARRLLPPFYRNTRMLEDMLAESSWVELKSDADVSVEIGALRNEIKNLRSRQHPSDCANSRALVVSLEDQLNLGSTLQYLNAALSFAAMDNRTMVLADHDRWLFVPPDNCPSRSWSCVFLPLSNCSEADLKAPAHVPLIESGAAAAAARGRPERVLHARAVYELFVAMGVHSYSAQAALAHELFRPAPSTFREAARVKRRRVGFSSASAAVHIRRGDKVAGPDAQADATAVRGYVGAVRGLVAEVGGVRTLFVATDDDQAARDAVHAVREELPGVSALIDAAERRAARTEVLADAAAGALSPEELSSRLDLAVVAFDAVANMALLVDARALAGTWSSTFGKVAQYTRVGRRLLACGDEVTREDRSDAEATRRRRRPEEDRRAARIAWADCLRCSQAYESLDASRFADFDPL